MTFLLQAAACHSNRALCLYKAGDGRACEVAATAALTLDASHPKARFWRVQARLTRGDTQAAAEDLCTLLHTHPSHREARALLEAKCVPPSHARTRPVLKPPFEDRERV